MEEYRNEAIKTIERAKYLDYDTNETLKRFYGEDKPEDLREVWKCSTDSSKLSKKEDAEIYDYPIKYKGVTPNQGFVNFEEKEIYYVESKQLYDVIDIIIKESQKKPELYGQGTEKLNSLIVSFFKKLYPRKIRLSTGEVKDIYDSDKDYEVHVINHLKKEYILFIHKDSDGLFHKLIIPLFRLEKESNKYKIKEYVGGLLHVLQHLQIGGKPISAIDKTQKGDTEFYSDVLFKYIFKVFFDVVSEETKESLQESHTRNFCIRLEEGLFLKGGFYYNHLTELWSINTIAQVGKC